MAMDALEVLYRDNHLLIVSKPAGVPTQPLFEERCREWLKAKEGKAGNAYLHVVHRLDTPVSGIVVCACSSKALSRLHAAMREGLFRKRYLALVTGMLPAASGVLEHYLFHDMERHRAIVVGADRPHAKLCRLSYRLLRAEGEVSLVAIDLETGRYHQIRAQLAAVGCPVVGDVKYGSRSSFAEGAIGLHHYEAGVPHPTLGTVCEVIAPPPAWPTWMGSF